MPGHFATESPGQHPRNINYIQENDYWLTFFDRFSLPEDADGAAIRLLFTELMKENFTFFRSNLEMQKIILWQISESNPLMRSLSEHREQEGAKLLKRAAPFFVNSGVNFNAVISFLLGGIYYLVLHAATNKSTVCGIDVNIESDRDSVYRTIEQIIDWTWEAGLAGHRSKGA